MKFLDSRVAALGSFFIAFLGAYVTFGALDAYEDVRLTATTFATLSATLFGFLMTSLSILVAISDRDFIKNLRLTGHYKVLVNQLFKTASFLLVTIVVSIGGHVLSDDFQKNFSISLAAGLLIISLLSFLTAGAKFKNVVIILIK
ncbi:hypothetical protein ACPF7Z_17305 [Halomonas sp. GXIMD04776]|uniref:hypothetical protein n=1 Tax=Halomonas sp. GXIMD04776 TaxID=3415605 RepID=UPI003CABE896